MWAHSVPASFKDGKSRTFYWDLHLWEPPCPYTDCLPTRTSKDTNSWTLVPIPAGKQRPRTSCAAASLSLGLLFPPAELSDPICSALWNRLQFLFVSLLNTHSSVSSFLMVTLHTMLILPEPGTLLSFRCTTHTQLSRPFQSKNSQFLWPDPQSCLRALPDPSCGVWTPENHGVHPELPAQAGEPRWPWCFAAGVAVLNTPCAARDISSPAHSSPFCFAPSQDSNSGFSAAVESFHF